MSIAEPPAPGWRDDLVASALGLAALAIACAPLALFVLAPDDRAGGVRALPEARGWAGFRWFGLASVVGAGPAFVLAKLALDRARRWPAKVPAALAIAAGLPMIAGVVIQIAWWTSG